MKKNIKHFLKHFKYSIFLYLSSQVISKISYLFLVSIFGRLIDSVIKGENITFNNFPISLLYALIAVVIISPIITWFSDKMYVNEGFLYEYSMYDKLLKQSFDLKLKFEEGVILDRFSEDLNDFKIFSYHVFSYGILSFIICISAFIYMAYTNIYLALLTFIIMIIQITLNAAFTNKIVNLHEEKQNARSELLNHEKHMIEGLEYIKNYEIEDISLKKMKEKVKKTNEKQYINSKLHTIITYVLETYDYLSQIVFIAFSMTLLISNIISVEKLMILIMLFTYLKEAFSSILKSYNDYLKLKAVNTRIDSLFFSEEDFDGNELDPILDLEFKDLSFKYDNENQVFDNYNESFKTGKIHYMKRPNGWGKSTLIKLLIGLLKPCNGSINLNGQGFNKYSLKSIRKSIAVSTQNPFVFNDSVYENIKIASDVSEDRIHEMMTLLDLLHLKDKVIKDFGQNLSGGEKQKISLVRTLLKESSLYIFDEPYNALDKKTKDKLKEYISTIDAMTIIISHQ